MARRVALVALLALASFASAADNSTASTVTTVALGPLVSPSGFQCQNNTDLVGTNLNRLAATNTAAACATACKAAAACTHFVMPAGGGCVLRGDLFAGPDGTPGSSTNVTLACIALKPANMACKSGWTLAGLEVANLSTTSVASCRDACLFNPRCRYYQSDLLANKCSLRTDPLLGPNGSTGPAAVNINTCSVDSETAAIVLALDASAICLGTPGLCAVPVSKVVLPGSHNSASFNLPATLDNALSVVPDLNAGPVRGVNSALRAVRGLASNQAAGPPNQATSGVRTFDLDACQFRAPFSNVTQARFCHGQAMINPLNPTPLATFRALLAAAAAAPRDLFVIRFSNLDIVPAPPGQTMPTAQKNAAFKAVRDSVLSQLAESGIMARVFTGAVNATTTVGGIVGSSRNVLLVWADDWLLHAADNGGRGYTVNRTLVPTIPSTQVYGETANVLNAAMAPTQVATAVLTQWAAGAARYDNATLRFLGLFPNACLPSRESCSKTTNTAGFITYMLTAPRTLEAVVRYSLPLGANHAPFGGSVTVDYVDAGPSSGSAWRHAVTKANIGWAMDYGQATQGKGGAYNQCAYVFNNIAMAADIVCKGRPQSLQNTGARVTHVYVPPGAKLTVVKAGKALGAPIVGAAVTGTLQAVGANAGLLQGTGWDTVAVV